MFPLVFFKFPSYNTEDAAHLVTKSIFDESGVPGRGSQMRAVASIFGVIAMSAIMASFAPYRITPQYSHHHEPQQFVIIIVPAPRDRFFATLHLLFLGVPCVLLVLMPCTTTYADGPCFRGLATARAGSSVGTTWLQWGAETAYFARHHPFT